MTENNYIGKFACNENCSSDCSFHYKKRFDAETTAKNKNAIIKEYALEIHNITGEKFPTLHKKVSAELIKLGVSETEIPGQRTFARWLENTVKLVRYDLDSAPLKYIYYLRKMKIINEAIWVYEKERQPLTTLFVDHAMKCMELFNDPKGEVIDLYAQWVVINEYYRRARIDSPTYDLDKYMEPAPWEDDGLMFRTAISNGYAMIPYLSMIEIVFDDSDPKNVSIGIDKDPTNPSMNVKTYAWLRLPVYAVYQGKVNGSKIYLPRPELQPDTNQTLMSALAIRNAFPLWRDLVNLYHLGKLG